MRGDADLSIVHRSMTLCIVHKQEPRPENRITYIVNKIERKQYNTITYCVQNKSNKMHLTGSTAKRRLASAKYPRQPLPHDLNFVPPQETQSRHDQRAEINLLLLSKEDKGEGEMTELIPQGGAQRRNLSDNETTAEPTLVVPPPTPGDDANDTTESTTPIADESSTAVPEITEAPVADDPLTELPAATTALAPTKPVKPTAALPPVASWTGSSNTTEIIHDIKEPKTVISELTAAIPEPPDHHKHNSSNASAPSCNTLSCQGLSVLNEHPLLYIFLFMAATLLCFLFKCKCCRREQRDSRGEYRAVGRMLAHNFDTDLSDEDDMNFYSEDNNAYDDEYDGHSNENGNGDGGWSHHGKGSIELGSIGADNLTLEEMNG